jgi:hypothetical protein
MPTRMLFALLAAVFACSSFVVPAHAARDRVFVASYGSDSNPCTFGSPCKTFQNAVNVVAAGGEVTAIDSAGFGPISITQSVTITSPAGIEAGIAAVAGGDAIDINAPGGTVLLQGLTLDGGNAAYNGINFTAGNFLTVTDCVMKNFYFNGSSALTGNGILMQPTFSGAVSFVIKNTIVENNGFVGLAYFPPSGSTNGFGIIDHVTAINNDETGIVIYGYGGQTTVAISNSIASNNGYGFFIENISAPMTVSIDNCGASNNLYGIYAENAPNVLLGRSEITSNGTGVGNATNASTFYSYSDNRINENNTDISSPLNYTLGLR